MIDKNVFLAPCSNERINRSVLMLESPEPSSKLKSIEGIIRLDSILDVLSPEEIARLKKIYYDRRVRLWGTRFRNVWNSMNIGDYVLFYQRNYVIGVAEVAFKTVNAALATKVWGQYETGETWQNIFFVKNVCELNLHRKVLNKIAGYDETFVPQGFMRMRNEASRRILKEIVLTSHKPAR